MKTLMMALVLIATTSLTFGQKFLIDGIHSSVVFSIPYSGISFVSGSFNTFKGDLELKGGLDGAKVSMEIDVKSIDTGVKDRDDHLRTADFFDAAKNPKITFSGTMKKKSGNKYDLVGAFTIKGKTKNATIPVTHGGEAKSRDGRTTHGFTLETTIKRSDFGIGNQGSGLGDDVKVNASFVVVAGK